MENRSTGEMAAQAVEAALRKKVSESRHLENVLKAFGKTLMEQARWKADLTEREYLQTAPPEPKSFENGIPVSHRQQLSRLGEMWPKAAELIIPSLQEGFPRLSENVARLRTLILDRSFSPDPFLSAAYSGRTAEARAIAESIGFDPEILIFILSQLARPVIARRAESLLPLTQGLSWHRGYCPICGSFPEMSLLKGSDGQRWLWCGFCRTSWRFYRAACPFCDSRKEGDSEFFFVEGVEHERVEVCHSCRRYVLGIDLRAFTDETIQEVMNISLLHLDAVAQKKGFLPMKGIGWKIREESRGGDPPDEAEIPANHSIH